MEGMDIEREPSEEIIKLEYDVMNKYFEVAGVTRDMRKEWINKYGSALRKITETDPDFLHAYVDENATAKELESKLQEYL